MSFRRAWSARTGAALAAIVFLATPISPVRAAAPAYTLEERARAIAMPALVFLEGQFSGVIHEKASGKAVSDHPLTVFVRCSGFVVNPDGTAVTIRSCVAPGQDQLNAWAFEAYANERVADKQLGEGDKANFIKQLTDTAIFSAPDDATTPPASALWAQMNVATGGLTADPAWSAQVLTPVESDTGLAVVKIGKDNLPAIDIDANSNLATSNTPVAIGYVSVNAKTLTARSHAVNVSGAYDKGTDSTYKLDTKAAWESRGGMLVNADGRAIGVLLPDLEGAIDVATDATSIGADLTRLGVKSQLGKNDLLYRSALDAYFGGRYDEAIDKFDQVLAASPANQTAADYRKQAADRQEIEGGSGTPLWVIILIVLVSLLLIAAVGAVVLFLRRRPSSQPRDEALGSVSVNPFAPMSPSAPTSTGGFPGYSTGYPTMTPVSSPPQILLQAAPPGTPVPQPPVPGTPTPQPVTETPDLAAPLSTQWTPVPPPVPAPPAETVQPQPVMATEPVVHVPPTTPVAPTVPVAPAAPAAPETTATPEATPPAQAPVPVDPFAPVETPTIFAPEPAPATPAAPESPFFGWPEDVDAEDTPPPHQEPESPWAPPAR